MDIQSTRLPDVKLIRPRRFADSRGWFSEIYKHSTFQKAGVELGFVQTNQSFSVEKGTVRGLHFQKHPHAQGKLVQVLQGCIWDVAVDIDPASSTFGEHVGVELDAHVGAMLYIPPNYAHGFCTLTPDTRVMYACTAEYAPECEGGIIWNDPRLAIDWPVRTQDAILSDKDKALPRWDVVHHNRMRGST